MRLRLLPLSAAAFALLVGALPTSARAQEGDVQPPPGTPQGVVVPPLPDVNDPMLLPVAPAPRSIGTLDEALSLVKARSTDLKTAYLEVKRSEAQSRVALAALLPTINGTVVGTHNFITSQSVLVTSPTSAKVIESPTPNFATGQASIVQPLIDVRSYHSWKTAQEVEEVKKLNVADMQRQISLNVANSLVSVVTAERVAELNRASFRTALERLDLTKKRRTLGAATGLDVARAQLSAEAARASIVTGDESLRQAREALGLALGLPQQVGVAKDLRLDTLERAASNTCKVNPDLEARPDLASLRQQQVVAARNVDNVKLRFLPTLNAQSSVATTTVDTGSSPSTTWNIQAVLSVPLWEGGARYGLLRDARAQEAEADLAHEAARRAATVQVEQARRGVEVAESALKVAADHRALAAETDRLVRAGYTEGQFTSLDLVTAADTLRAADIDLALKQFGLVQARIGAILALSTCSF